MTPRKKDLSVTTVRSADIDVQIGEWFTEPLKALIEERFDDHEVTSVRLIEWDGCIDGFISVRVEMGQL